MTLSGRNPPPQDTVRGDGPPTPSPRRSRSRPAPPGKKNRPWTVIALIGGAAAVLIVAVVAVLSRSGGGDREYTVSAPPTAGGYPKADAAGSDPYATAFKNLLGAWGTVVSASYDADGIPVNFTGVSGSGLGDENEFRESLESSSVGNRLKIHDTDPGGPGTAGCAEMPVTTFKVPLCYWQTGTSLGLVTSGASADSQTLDWTRLAEIMRGIRPDVEKPA